LATNAAKLKKVLLITRSEKDEDADRWVERTRQILKPIYPKANSIRERAAMIVRNGQCLLEISRRVPCEASSFVQVSDVTGRDAHCFYWTTTVVPEVDAASAEHIGDSFYKDANHVFCLWGSYLPITRADPQSFRFIEPPTMAARYAVDHATGYCLMYGSQRMKIKRFKLPNPGQLRVTGPALATDGITAFKNGIPVKAE
jgi:hypothetical protein